MFTERHYKAIADLLVKTGFNHPQLIEAFCELFAGDNERFKPELFKKRAQLSEENGLDLSMNDPNFDLKVKAFMGQVEADTRRKYPNLP